MNQCNHCGATIKDTAVFCRYCGQKVSKKNGLDTNQMSAEQFYVMSEKIKSTINDLTEAYAKGIVEKNTQCEALREKADNEAAQLRSNLEKLRAEFEDLKKEKESMDKLVATLAAEKQGLLAELQKGKSAQDEAGSNVAPLLMTNESTQSIVFTQDNMAIQEETVKICDENALEQKGKKISEKKRRKSTESQVISQKETAPKSANVKKNTVEEQDTVTATTKKTENCSKCNAKTDPEMLFCAECGEKLR